MIKKLFNLSLMAALMCGLSLGFASCSDDDDNSNAGTDNSSGDDQEIVDPNDTPEIHTAWAWISAITDAETQPEGWDQQTYEPTIGQPSLNNVNARVIFVRDIDDARMNFSSIAGCSPADLKTKKTVDAGQYGRMEWAPSDPGAPNIAVVDVDTKLIPKLSRIIYCTPDQADENASGVTGTAYYRLGDVVEDADGYYWVCVRPSFSQNKATDSYWVNIFNAAESGRGEKTGNLPGIPQANIYSKYNKKYNDNTILLPTALKSSREHCYNLSNMVEALLFPGDYKDKVGTEGKGLCGFDYKYHGVYYLTKVNQYWQEAGIWEKLFNRNYGEMKGLHLKRFFYYGYHWKVGSTAGVWIYKGSSYKTQYTGSLDDDDTLFEMKVKNTGFDIRRYASDPLADKNCATATGQNCAPKSQFNADQAYWVVRYRSGKQLDSQKKYDPLKAITGVHEIYRYNAKTQKLESQPNETEEDLIGNNNPDLYYTGYSHYHLGDVYKDQYGHRWFIASPSGICFKSSNNYGEEKITDFESSPWTTLISFEGLEYDKNNPKRITNLPNMKEAIRGMVSLFAFWEKSVETLNSKTKFVVDSVKDNFKMAACINEAADIDVRRLFQCVTAQNGDTRQPSQMVSVMYNDGNTGKQSLMRYVINQQNDGKYMEPYVWTYYPKNPSSTATKLGPNDFSTVGIFLQDLCSDDMVKKYAEDSYARQPLTWASGGDGKKTRLPRSTAEPRADTVSYYLYNRDAWENNTYLGDMWNAPILAFRTTRVKDRGDNNYSTVTEDGLTLTPVKEVEYADHDEYESVTTLLQMIFTQYDLVRVNGKPYSPYRDPFVDK